MGKGKGKASAGSAHSSKSSRPKETSSPQFGYDGEYESIQYSILQETGEAGPSSAGNKASSSDSKTKKHECSECGRRYSRLEHLRRHEHEHTKGKRFVCEVCGKAFGRLDLKQRHLSVHTDTGDQRRASDGSVSSSVGTRPRVSQACKACAKARAKCDDKKPCSRCRHRNITCEPSVPARSNDASSLQQQQHHHHQNTLQDASANFMSSYSGFGVPASGSVMPQLENYTGLPAILSIPDNMIDPALAYPAVPSYTAIDTRSSNMVQMTSQMTLSSSPPGYTQQPAYVDAGVDDTQAYAGMSLMSYYQSGAASGADIKAEDDEE